MILTYLFIALVGLYTAAAAVLDFRLRRIPNYLTVPAALTGFIFHVASPSGWGALTSLSGFALGFSLLIIPWLLKGSGMGDVKLLAALGAWLGPQLTLIAFAISMATAASMAIVVLIYVACVGGLVRSQRRLQNSCRSDGRRPVRVLPFAVPVAMSTWCLLAWLLSQGNL